MEYTAKQLERIIKQAGWYRVDQRGSHRQYKHHSLPGKITISFHSSQAIPIGTARKILKEAGVIEKEER